MAMKIDTMRWKERFPNAGVKVEVAHGELMKIKDKNGTISPDQIVDAARRKNNPLHSLFTWDNSAAAAKYRLSEASALLRSIEITYTVLPNQSRRAFEITQKKRAGDEVSKTLYGTAEEASADPDNHAALIAEAIRTLMAWRNRFRYIQDLSKLIEKIDSTIDELAAKTV